MIQLNFQTKPFILFLFLIHGIISSAQTQILTTDSLVNKTVRLSASAHAERFIVQLKDSSTLLVRIPSRKQSLQQLIQNGQQKVAVRLEAEQHKRNLQLVTMLRQYFTFCPVYFFYTDETDLVLNGMLDQVHFLNDQLAFDTTLKINTPYYFTAENGLLEDDFFDETTPTSAGSKNTFYAFILKDKNFVQLKKPFPYYVKTMSNTPNSKEWEFAFKRLNQKLEGYYRFNVKSEKL